MKNADMPAMPTHDVFEHCGFDGNSGPHLTQTTNYGLTKREMMAMHAPDAPEWFERQWCEKNGGNVSYFDYKNAISPKSLSNYACWITVTGASEMYFAWRAHYADSILAELDRTSK